MLNVGFDKQTQIEKMAAVIGERVVIRELQSDLLGLPCLRFDFPDDFHIQIEINPRELQSYLAMDRVLAEVKHLRDKYLENANSGAI